MFGWRGCKGYVGGFVIVFFFQAEDGIRVLVRSRGLGDVYKRQGLIIAAVLLSTLFFKQTTSAYYPWQRNVLFGRGIQNSSVPILKGKILTKEYNSFYEEVFDVIKPYKKCCYIVNYTRDVVAFVMNDLPRVQISPCLLYTSPSPRDRTRSRMPSSA